MLGLQTTVVRELNRKGRAVWSEGIPKSMSVSVDSGCNVVARQPGLEAGVTGCCRDRETTVEARKVSHSTDGVEWRINDRA